MGLVAEVLDALHIARVSLAGYEADDLIATLATRARDEGDDVLIVTGDRDAYQLVEDPHVRVLYNKRGVSDYALYDETGIRDRTGVDPSSYVDFAALRGDPSDNLPGVPGVGEKTAAKLINAYGDVAGVLAHTADQTPKLRQNLEEHADLARRNVELMRLVRDAPLEVSLDDLAFASTVDAGPVRRCFDFLEFRGLLSRLGEVIELAGDDPAGADAGPVVVDPEAEVCSTGDHAVQTLGALRSGDGPLLLVGAWEPSGRQLQGLVLGTQRDASRVVVLPAALLEDPTVRDAVQELFDAGGVAGHGVKELVRCLLAFGIELSTLVFDSMLAAYLINPARASYSVEEVADEVLHVAPSGPPPEPQGTLELEGSSPAEDEFGRAGRAALLIGELIEPLGAVLEDEGMTELLTDIELPLVGVLARMEHVGVGVDRGALEELLADLTRRARELTSQIHEDAGSEFNVNSTKQLRSVLFDQLGLTPQKKTKTGYSTDAATLERLRGDHPIVDHLLAYREVEKLRSTYGEGLLSEVREDGRIHATFNQTVARTGRLSSDRPNLHNIPVRSLEGRAFRRVFVPRPGTALLVADYNQVELRCIAHLSGDPGLVEAFARGEDIHTATAAQVFGVEPDEVTHEQRSRAKMVSYGLVYGMEAYGLAQRLGIEVGEASGILEAYFAAFPSVRAYMDATVERARELGYTETLFGRRRPIPELASSNARLRAAGERQAMNAGIQGLAADLFKIALVRLDAAIRAGEFSSTLILQVHDEVLLEVPFDESDAMATLTEEVMVGAADLSVPLEVHLAFGENWADAKD